MSKLSDQAFDFLEKLKIALIDENDKPQTLSVYGFMSNEYDELKGEINKWFCKINKNIKVENLSLGRDMFCGLNGNKHKIHIEINKKTWELLNDNSKQIIDAVDEAVKTQIEYNQKNNSVVSNQTNISSQKLKLSTKQEFLEKSNKFNELSVDLKLQHMIDVFSGNKKSIIVKGFKLEKVSIQNESGQLEDFLSVKFEKDKDSKELKEFAQSLYEFGVTTRDKEKRTVDEDGFLRLNSYNIQALQEHLYKNQVVAAADEAISKVNGWLWKSYKEKKDKLVNLKKKIEAANNKEELEEAIKAFQGAADKHRKSSRKTKFDKLKAKEMNKEVRESEPITAATADRIRGKLQKDATNSGNHFYTKINDIKKTNGIGGPG